MKNILLSKYYKAQFYQGLFNKFIEQQNFMNEIKSLLISRISDIKLLKQFYEKKQQKTNRESKEQLIISKINLDSMLNDVQSSKKSLFDQRCNQLSQKQFSIHDPIHLNLYDLFKNMSDMTHFFRKREKMRSNKQIKLLTTVNTTIFSSKRQIQEFYYFSADIFAAYDSQFNKYKKQSSFMSISMEENLKKLYSFFFLKHDQKQEGVNFIPEALRKQILNLSPSFFLAWIRKYMMKVFQSLLNLNEVNNVSQKCDKFLNTQKPNLNKNLSYDVYSKAQQKLSFNFISRNKSVQQTFQKIQKQKNQLTMDKSFQGIIQNFVANYQAHEPQLPLVLNSKESVYSYCLDQMKKYYKCLPIEDLDIGYLRNIRKIGKKEDILIGNALNMGGKILIESKNSEIKCSLLQFEDEYKKSCIPKVQALKIKDQINLSKLSETEPVQNQRQFLIENKKKNSNLLQLIASEQLSFSNEFLPNYFDRFDSKLLSPNARQSFSQKNRIKYSNKKDDENLFLFGENEYDSNHRKEINFSQQTKKHNFHFQNYKSRSNVISEESAEIEFKLELLKKFNKRNLDYSEPSQKSFRMINKPMKKSFQQSSYSQEKKFLDDHIEDRLSNQKLPKLMFKECSANKNLDNLRVNPQVFCEIKKHKQLYPKSNRKQFIIQDSKLNILERKQSSCKIYRHYSENRSQDLTDIILNKKKLPENQRRIIQQNIGRRFSSQTAEKQTIRNGSIDDRPRSNFSIKSKAFVGNKKMSLNYIKFTKSKPKRNDLLENSHNFNQNQEIKNKFNGQLKNGPLEKVSNIFTTEQVSLIHSDKKDDFIKYLKKLQKERKKVEVYETDLSKQKQKRIKRQLV